MAIHRGIQSAIFFYLSCAPCAEARYRKKRKQEAVWNRAERDALQEEMPDIYRHPEPSSTNPYWQSEIAFGPVLSSRGGNHKNKGKNNTNGGKKASKEVLSSNVSMAGASSLDLNTLQREDEILWGTGETMMDGAGSAGVQRPPRAARRRGMSNDTTTTTATTSTAAAYSNYRSPPVSELLPPIVRTVHSREEVAWMMQPPPVADVMSGKREGGGMRSGASSRMARTISRGSSGGGSSVLYAVGESPKTLPVTADTLRRPISSRSGGGEMADLGPPIRRRVTTSRPPLLSTIASEGNNTQEEGTYLSMVDSAKSHNPDKLRHRARSNSESRKGGVGGGGGGGKEDGLPKRRTFANGDSENHHSSSPPIFSPSNKVLPRENGIGRDRKGRNEDGEEEEEEETLLFDSWYTPDFELGRWVHEHTRREGVKERWSFDV